MASAADVASKELPPGTIHVSEFNPSSIHPNAHLFFDDDRKYIDPVQETMNARNFRLRVYIVILQRRSYYTHTILAL